MTLEHILSEQMLLEQMSLEQKLLDMCRLIKSH
jgi:hypothetical protein